MTETMHDVCALPLVQRLAVILDRDPGSFSARDKLPRGWHVAMFNAPTPQADLRTDGLAGLGVPLPELGLPRIMAAGRRTTWHNDIKIGAAVQRDSRIAGVVEKQGRSGRFAIVTIEHRISEDELALVEEQDYVMREPDTGGPAAPAQAAKPRPAAAERSLVPDETLLLRYCAVTFNAHRIHYDQAYAMGVEGYPALVVNGGIPVLALLELYRSQARREPDHIVLRNLAPLFCGRTIRLCASPSNMGWQLWAEDEGRLAVEMTVT